MVLMFTTRHAPVTPPMKEKSRAFISLPTSFVGLTLSNLNSVIELRSSIYPGEPLRPRPLDGRVSATRNLGPKEAWTDAYRHTPHGKPVELGAGQGGKA